LTILGRSAQCVAPAETFTLQFGELFARPHDALGAGTSARERFTFPRVAADVICA